MLLLVVNKKFTARRHSVRNPSPVPQACAACASVSCVHLPARCADPNMGNTPSSPPPPSPPSPSGFSFHSSPKSWHAARQDCQSRGGDLASIHSEAEHREAFALTGGLTHGLGSMTKRTRATMCGRMGRRWTTMGGRRGSRTIMTAMRTVDISLTGPMVDLDHGTTRSARKSLLTFA